MDHQTSKEQLFTAIAQQNVQGVKDFLISYLESIKSRDKFITAALELMNHCYSEDIEITRLVIREVFERDINKILGVHLLESAVTRGGRRSCFCIARSRGQS